MTCVPQFEIILKVPILLNGGSEANWIMKQKSMLVAHCLPPQACEANQELAGPTHTVYCEVKKHYLQALAS